MWYILFPADSWQIKVHSALQEKATFTTPQGLLEFWIMPFRLINTPSVLQWLMQQVMKAVNPLDGPTFVTAYVDDLLIFSSVLTEHFDHLHLIMKKLRKIWLKLNFVMCWFLCKEVEYLGHVITPIHVSSLMLSRSLLFETILHHRMLKSWRDSKDWLHTTDGSYLSLPRLLIYRTNWLVRM